MFIEEKLWLIAILPTLAVMVGLILYAQKKKQAQLAQFASTRLLQALLQSYSPFLRGLKNAFIFVSLVLLCVTLARPQWGYTWQETQTKGIDILFALDTSKSMLADDIRPNRIERSKFAILDFVDKLESDRIGLVAFAGGAFLQCPLTLDYEAFRQSLEAVDTDIIPIGGTDIAQAIQGSEQAFSNDNNHKLIILITDGEDLEESGITRAEEASENGVTIYTVGVGTENGALIPIGKDRGRTQYLKDEQGNNVMTQLDIGTLSKIAETTGGFYAPLEATGSGLEQVYQAGLKTIPQQDLASQMQKLRIERFQWFLGIAILLLAFEPFITTRRSASKRSLSKTLPQVASLWIAALILTALPNDVKAGSEGETLFQQGDVENAIAAFQKDLEDNPGDTRLLYNLGTTFYEQGNHDEALSTLNKALVTEDLSLQSAIFYNLGNTYFRIGQNQERESLKALEEAPLENFYSNFEITPQAIEAGKATLDKSPQERKTMWDQLEALLKQIETEVPAAQKYVEGIQAIAPSWEDAVTQYNSALELNAEDADAAYNQKFVSQKISDLNKEIEELSGKLEQQKKNIELLKTLIEALKKPTLYVLNAEQRADQLIEAGYYQPANSILSEAAQQDPTAEVYKQKQERLGKVAEIAPKPKEK